MVESYHLTAYSGYAVLFDPATVTGVATREPDRELLDEARAAGALVYVPVSDEHVTISLAIDEPQPARYQRAGSEHHRGPLRVTSGRLWLADPTFLTDLSAADAAYRAGPIDLQPGDYEATAPTLSWPADAHERYLRASAGRLRVAARDVLALATFLLAVTTFIALPVFLIGRGLDDGIEGMGGALSGAALVLVPLWVVLVMLWRLPTLRAVERADEAFLESHPDAAIALRRLPPRDR